MTVIPYWIDKKKKLLEIFIYVTYRTIVIFEL